MTLSAHEFLHRGRGRRPPSLAKTAGRWGVWARTIAARHVLVARQHRGGAMTLYAPSYALHLSSRRWQLNAWSLFPRVNLTVAPLLNRLAPESFLRRRAASATARAEFAAGRGGDAASQRGAAVGTPARGRDAGPARPTQWPPENGLILARRETGGRRVVEQTEAREVIPLSRVFRRAELGESEAGRQQTAALVGGLRGLARRVTEERRRVEQQARGATVMQQRAQPRHKGFERGDEADASHGRLRPGGFDPARDAPAAAARAAPPALNIQQLTDEVIRQIDSRIVAHKERMGKLF